MRNQYFLLYVRNFIFGAEDSLVSTVGLLAGIASAGVGQKEIVITGLVLISVEAFSMAVGSFLSERTTEESVSGFNENKSKSRSAAGIMLGSYLLFGFIPLLPYLIVGGPAAFWASIFASLAALFVLGFISAKILVTNTMKSAIRMLVIGGVAIGLGTTIGLLFQ